LAKPSFRLLKDFTRVPMAGLEETTLLQVFRSGWMDAVLQKNCIKSFNKGNINNNKILVN